VATKVIMPKQGLQMTEGTIIKWLKQEGERIESGQPLFEMETDKLTITIDAAVSGTLLKIVKAEGEVVPITEMIAVIGELGEDIGGLLADGKVNQAPEATAKEAAGAVGAVETAIDPEGTTRAAGEKVFITPRAKTLAQGNNLDYLKVNGTGPEGLIVEKDVQAYLAALPAQSETAGKVTPVAAKLAGQHQVKLAEVGGSGVRGKVMKADIEAAIAARSGKTASGTRKGRIIPFAGMRKVIADRMTQSLQGMAQANHRMKVDMTEIIRFREKLKAAEIKVSFTDIFVKVVAKALLDFPMANASLTDEGILVKDYVNMGLAVAVENGLIVPVIKDADLMTLGEIATVAAELIAKAKSGQLQPDDYTGGTFTITNLGMFGIDEFTAIINPPESAILAVGKIEKTPVVVDDAVVIRPVMTLSLTYDHRVIDGAPAAQFLQRVKQILQNPYLLI
jgi:pyruvate dehydrogenase E2 component (dihydrolipoamide acetyltransferase)